MYFRFLNISKTYLDFRKSVQKVDEQYLDLFWDKPLPRIMILVMGEGSKAYAKTPIYLLL